VVLSDLERVFSEGTGREANLLNESIAEERRARIVSGKPLDAVEGDIKKLDLPTIASLTEDLVMMAKDGLLDEVSGRAKDIAKVARILSQRQLSSVTLTGDQGVGKTAIPEGLAVMIANGEAPTGLENARIMKLNLGKLSKKCNCPNGPSAEDVIKDIAAEVAQAQRMDPPVKIIFFIDEIGKKLLLDPNANLIAQQMKDFLARGQIQVIGACTTEEFRESVRKDPALNNRLSPHEVQEPSPKDAVGMLLTNMERYAKFHGVKYDAGAAQAAVDMAVGAGRREDMRLPRGAIYWMDAAGAAVKLQLKGDPPQLRVLRADIREKDRALKSAVGDSKEAVRLREVLTAALDAQTKEFERLEPVVANERRLLNQLTQLGERLEVENKVAETGELRDAEKMKELMTQIEETQREIDRLPERYFSTEVDAFAVYKEVAVDLGVEVERVKPIASNQPFEPGEILLDRVYGQDDAVASIARRLKLDRAKLRDPKKPVGAHFLAGPSGVGKTELAKSTADEFYNGAIESIDCNRLQERHELAILKGAPPGYVGYGETIDLAETIRKLNNKGGGVLLLDEIEKAHPDIFPLIMQIIDEGFFVDNQGKRVDCSRIHLMMTSNLGNQAFAKYAGDGEYTNQAKVMAEFEAELAARVPPEVIGRILEIGSLDVFLPLAEKTRHKIVKSQIERLSEFGGETRALTFDVSDEAIKKLSKDGFHPKFGGRSLKGVIGKQVTDPLSDKVLAGEVPDGSLMSVILKKGLIDFDIQPLAVKG
jgi:ATP-dependent Clp protease ATP-binding subunit ClpB